MKGQTMTPILNPFAAAPREMGAYLAYSQSAVDAIGLEPGLLHLVKVRASQLNGCANCLNMHTQEARADGETDRDFCRASRRAGKKQVCHVRAGDQQDDRRQTQERGERRPRFAMDVALASRSRLDQDLAGLEARHCLVAHVPLERRLDLRDDRPVLGVQRHARLFD